MLAQAAILAFAFLMILAAITDVRGYTIPNWIVGALIALWPAAAIGADLGWADAGAHLLIGFAALAAGMALWAPGFLGGGDAKLLAAGALWFGWPDVFGFVLLACAAGGVLALALIGLRAAAPALRLPPERVAGTPLAQGAPAPYAVAIAAGALMTIPAGPLAAAAGV
jgi:prepilin peptidase CpaA